MKVRNRFRRRVKVASKRASREGRKHFEQNLLDRLPKIRNVRLLVAEWALLVLVMIMLSIAQMFWYRQSYAIDDAWTSGGNYTEATLGKVNSLNPLFATTSSEKTLSRLMFASLAVPDYSGHMGLGLAQEISPNEDGTVWGVKLKEGLKWSDGEAITADDVIYTVGVIQSSAVNTSYSSNLSGVKATVGTGGVVYFTLPAGYASFISALDFPILPSHILSEVAPAQLLEHGFSSSPVTSGAFSFHAVQSVGAQGEKIVYLSANPNYYGGKALLDSFTVHAFLSTEEIIEAMQSETVTATAELDPVDGALITNGATVEKQTALSSGVFAFFNTKNGVLSNLNVRRALQKGIDMESLRAPLGEEFPLNYPLVENQIDIPEYPVIPAYDQDAAREAIRSMNNGEGASIRLATVNTGYFPALSENLEYQLENLGFKVETTLYAPGQEFLTSVIRPRNYDILLYEVELGSDPDLFAYYHSSQAVENGLNLSNYVNSTASDLLLAARGTMDYSLRAAKYQSFLKHWVDDVPALGIYQVSLSYYVNKNVRSFSEEDRLVTALDRFSDVLYWSARKTVKNRTP